LVDLDLRKREFIAAMRDTSLRDDRLREMKEELAHMDEEIAALKPVVKTQLVAIWQHEPEPHVENIATLGLLGIAIDGFSSSTSRGVEAPSTKVGQYLVTDLGSFATVLAPKGQSYHCNLFGNIEDGAGIRCEPAK
jgi:hypothetical protein